MSKRYKNPILPGFYPDPSICKVEDDFYLVTSTFSYFPGVPIFHSKDMIHFKQIGNVLSRESQLNLTNAGHSHGIFAPTLRYHQGTFYMITTNIGNGGNFIVTTTNPAGPWSEPYFLDSHGIDPSLFFDDDGKCYYCGTKDRREGAKYYGDNEIYVQELDLSTMKLVGESKAIWHGALKDVVWPEGPHIYKRNGYYYLLISEAGTAHEHAITVARSKDIFSYYEGYNANPILTHRHLGQKYPITNVGHGDLIEVSDDEWYMVLLGSRPYGGYYRNLGRETFLVPVTFENDWPVVNYGIGVVEDTILPTSLKVQEVTKVNEKEDFNDTTLPYHFLHLRNPIISNYSLTERAGYLRLYLAKEMIKDQVSPTFTSVRQTSKSFYVNTYLEFKPQNNDEVAGLVIIQNNKYYYQFTLGMIENCCKLLLYGCNNGVITLIASTPYDSSSVYLSMEAKEQSLSFRYGKKEDDMILLKDNVDARILSTDVAGGFVGNTVGIYASSSGNSSNNYADFDFLEYRILE